MLQAILDKESQSAFEEDLDRVRIKPDLRYTVADKRLEFFSGWEWLHSGMIDRGVCVANWARAAKQ